MDIKPKTVKWEVSNFSQDKTFDTLRCINDRLGGFLSEDINRRSMVSSRNENLGQQNLQQLHFGDTKRI